MTTRLKFYCLLPFALLLLSTQSMAQINPVAEKYITYLLSKKTPYHVQVLNNDFIVNNVNAYPPGGLTKMFAEFLIENNLLKNKVIADVGFGCLPLGIIAVKNGANTVIGSGINEYALQCATDNLLLNNIDTKKVHLFKGYGVSPLLSNFAGKVDIIVARDPWDSISKADFEAIAPNRKPLSRAFYDVNDDFMTSLMVKGFELLSDNGRMFITSSTRVIGRIKQLCLKHQLDYKIVKETGKPGDNKRDYVLEIIRKK